MILPRSNSFRELPTHILWSALFLTAVGLIVLNSISQHSSGGLFQNPFSKQLLFLIPAVIVCIVIYHTPRSLVHKYSYALYCLGIILVVLPFFGAPQAGTHRWLYVGLPFSLQPSEFVKICTIIALARYLSDHNLQMKKFTSVIIPIILVLFPTMIILQQPDLGTAIIMIAPILPMLYWAGASFFHLFLLLAPIFSILTAFHTLAFTTWAAMLALIIFISRPKLMTGLLLFFGNIFLGLFSPVLWNGLKPYQQNRILTLVNPGADPLGAAYQIIQSKTAIGSGGLVGKGWGAGTQTQLKFLPVQESDFILSVMGEELGFIAIAAVLVVFGYFSVQILKYSYLSKDRFSSLVMIGCATVFISHVFVNTAMTVGLIPVKGLPFPFISAGGSFLITSYIMLGLVLKLSINYSD